MECVIILLFNYMKNDENHNSSENSHLFVIHVGILGISVASCRVEYIFNKQKNNADRWKTSTVEPLIYTVMYGASVLTILLKTPICHSQNSWKLGCFCRVHFCF